MGKTIGRVVGPLGGLFVFFALFSRVFITGEFNWIVWGQLGLGLAGIGLWAATAVDDMRNIATGRGSVFVVTAAVSTVALVGALVGLNYWAAKKRVEWDLTKGGIHTLAEQTQGALKGLTEETKVKVSAFYRPADPEYAALDELLRRYKIVGGDTFEYEFVDLFKNPTKAKAMSVTAQGPRVVFKSANGKEARAKEISEESLTNALAELSRGTEKKVYVLKDHGEKSVGKGAEQAAGGLKLWADGLKNEGYKVEELSLLAKKDVPSDAQAVVVAGPQSPLSEGEVDALKRYAEGGGRLVVMLDPGIETGLESLVKSWGVEPMSGVIVDPASQQPLWAISQEFSEHPIATPKMSILGALAFVFPDARGLKKGAAEGYTVTELFKTGPEAWEENDPIDTSGEEARVEKGANDVAGPVVLAAAVSKKGEGDKELRAVVFGDSDFMTNQFIRQGGNRDLALNTMQWLGGQEQKITIRPKMREKSTLAFLTANQRLFLSFGSLNLLPLVLIAFGLSVHSLRRSK